MCDKRLCDLRCVSYRVIIVSRVFFYGFVIVFESIFLGIIFLDNVSFLKVFVKIYGLLYVERIDWLGILEENGE